MKVLELSFAADMGTAKVNVRNPKDSLTPEEVKSAMDAIVQANVFNMSVGNFLRPKSAKIVDRSIQEIELPE